MNEDLMRIVERLRQDMSGDVLVMEVCDALEDRLKRDKRDREEYLRRYVRAVGRDI